MFWVSPRKLLLTFSVCFGQNACRSSTFISHKYAYLDRIWYKKFEQHNQIHLDSCHFSFDSYLLIKWSFLFVLNILFYSVTSTILLAHRTKMLTKVHPHRDKFNSEPTAKRHTLTINLHIEWYLIRMLWIGIMLFVCVFVFACCDLWISSANRLT